MNIGTEVKVPCRVSFVHVAEPRPGYAAEPRYSCTLLIEKNDEATLDAVQAAIEEAVQKGLARKWNDSMPDEVRSPLKDGDEERADDPAYRGCYFITATTGNKPELIDQNANRIEDRTKIYSGCYCNVLVDMFPYKSLSFDGKPAICGIAAELEAIQLVREGESLSNSRSGVLKWFQPVV